MDLPGLALMLGVGLVIAWSVGVWGLVRRLTRPPRRGYTYALSRGLPSNPAELPPVAEPGGWGPPPLRFEEFEAKLRGGEASAKCWSVAGLRPEGPVVVFTHGWGESRVFGLPRLAVLAAGSKRVVMWDMPGQGESTGCCTLGEREVEDLREIVQAATGASDRVVLAGFSMGAGVSIALAAVWGQRSMPQLAGVVAEAPYRVPHTPARRVLEGANLPWRLMLGPAVTLVGWRLGQGLSWRPGPGSAPRFDRAALARRVGVRMLVLQGENDDVSPREDAEAIAAAAPRGRLEMIAGAGHTDVWFQAGPRERAIATVRAFLDELAREQH